jgi:V/A-type H+-transporting ATPase subunit E
MSSDLQGLIDRIRKEGVEQAESEAGDLLTEARRKAGAILRQAEIDAQALRDRARAEAAAFEEQGRQTLAKTARDLIMMVQQAVERSLAAVIHQKVAAAMDPDLLRDLIPRVVEAYLKQEEDAGGVDLLISEEDQSRVVEYFLGSFRSAIDSGLEIRSDRGVVRGFKVALDGENVRHDFTAAAIAESMAAMVRPRLAEILRQAGQSAAIQAG